jgi:tetratricopeptide (TPR) repeat protein
LLSAVRHASYHGLHTHSWQLAWVMEDYLDRRGYWHDLLDSQRVALDAAEQALDRLGQGDALQGLARAYDRLGRHDEAQALVQSALDIYREVGLLGRQAYAHQNLGTVNQHRDLPGAIRHTRQALDLFSSIDHLVGQSSALCNLAWHYALSGDYHQAIVHGQQAIFLQIQVGDRNRRANTLHSLGYANYKLGRHEDGIQYLRQALEIHEKNGNQFSQATTMNHLADAEYALGNTDLARERWRLALRIFDELAHSDAEEVRAKLDDALPSPPVNVIRRRPGT